ncbi:related to nitrogen fixation protein fixI [Phialocephala subalpina]|uniref:Related to nitrogen fixation protein fixI n=1 Tax=Phialocephala subalpina TaxID=576137 RepID=A0A1L7WZ76_9HELO|nr:related to nitrogen fixation protein fixI [Phialocephala subalpina]
MSGSQIHSDTSGLRQRSCKRVSCKVKLPKTAGQSSNCCDDKCLDELARRECNSECGHDTASIEKSELRGGEASNGSKMACEQHCKKTRDQYGAILENLGCICKILLSLNIESCCVIPSHASVRSKGSAKSGTSKVSQRDDGCGKKSGCCGGATKEVDIVDDCSKESCCGKGLVPSATVPVVEDNCNKGCCGEISECLKKTAEDNATSEIDHRSKESCCGNGPVQGVTAPAVENNCKKGCCGDAFESPKTHDEGAGAKVEDCFKESRCRQSPTPKAPTDTTSAGDDSCGGSCCDDSSETIQDVVSPEVIPKRDECSKASCCGQGPSPGISKAAMPTIDDCYRDSCCGDLSKGAKNKTIDNHSSEAIDDYSEESCCSKGPAQAAPKDIAPPVDECCEDSCCASSNASMVAKTASPRPSSCAKDSCCGSGAGKVVLGGTPIRTDDCAGKSCCSKGALKLTSAIEVAETDDCSKDDCCTSKLSKQAAISDCVKEVASAPTSTSRILGTDSIDIEKGLFHVEHLILSISGMTCTGCEKKLFRSLDSLPSISNIKTSLVLAQAEFDVSSTSTIDTVSVIKTIEKMTGFTCSKMTQSGQDLDLIVNNMADFANKSVLPLGVTDLGILNKNTIRVTYHPNIVGARELLADPSFREADLAPYAARPLIASGRAHVRMTFFMTVLSAVLTIPVLVLAWAPLPKHEVLYGAISLVLATTVQVAIAGPFYTAALKALIFSRMIEMDLLIVISTTTAYVYSVIAYAYLAAGKPLSTGEFFETSTLLVTLIMVGRAVSAFARQRAVESISIESLQTPTALLVDPKTHQVQEIDARLLQYQDTFKVLPDSSIVTDGMVVAGESDINESMITGESKLIFKRPGSSVVAGSVNHSGTLTVRLTRLPGENTIQTIGSMVDEAKSSKPRIQQIADRVAGYFVPSILAITAIVFVIWVAVGKAVRHQDASTTCIVAMTYAISALIVSCPCAIGLAVPLVVVIAGGVAAKQGLIFKSAETIEIARKISHVVFDKTGTLTQGKLSVEVEEYPTGRKDGQRPMILGLTAHSKHPVSVAIASYMKGLGIQPAKVDKVVSVPGKGIEATWNGRLIRAGNPYWLGFEVSPAVLEVLSHGLTVFCISLDGALVAVFGLQDLVRSDAMQTISQLKKRSIEVSIVSGDNESVVNSIAFQLGVPNSHVRSRQNPGDKQEYIKSLLSSSSSKKHKKPLVVFVGDGTNDAVALAQASIGIHMNEGTDIAQSASDVVLMRPSLSGILTLIDLSRAFHRRVVFNFTWAFVYNVFAILLAAGAFPHVRIEPAYAGLGEIVSVLPVIFIAVQLKWVKFSK